MKQHKKYSVYRDPITNQAVFTHAIRGEKIYGTDWDYERKLREIEKQTQVRRKQNKDIGVASDIAVASGANTDTDYNLFAKQ